MILNPTLACADLLRLADEIDILLAQGISMLHLDIMDGHYVPNLCFSVDSVAAVAAYTSAELDVHLMVDQPLPYIAPLAAAGVSMVSVHLDAPGLVQCLDSIRSAGMKAGLVLNPGDCPVEIPEQLLSTADFVQLMAVHPGKSGQPFLPQTLGTLSALATYRKQSQLPFLISIDGGIDAPSAIACRKRGADILVVGARCIFRQEKPLAEALREFRRIVEGESSL